MGVIESISLEFLGVVLVNSPLGSHKEYIFFSVYDIYSGFFNFLKTLDFIKVFPKISFFRHFWGQN